MICLSMGMCLVLEIILFSVYIQWSNIVVKHLIIINTLPLLNCSGPI